MSGKIINRCKYWGQLLLLPVYGFSFLFPRDKRIWLFGSTFGKRFADNPRYFYLYMSQHKEEFHIRPIWISGKRELVTLLKEAGYEAYYRYSIKGIWYALRGKVYFYDNYAKDINFWLSGGALKFNMWHGIPLKKIQADNIFDKIRHPKNRWEAFQAFPRRLSDEKPSHYVLTTSEFMRPIFSSAFQTKNVSTAGYPRIDSFVFREIQNLYTDTERKTMDKIKKRMREKNADTILYYMPTFRDSETDFFHVIHFKQFHQFLQENHLLFCVKLHPKSKLKERFRAIEGGNIVDIDADTDPYVFIPMSDMLITDYSSIYFDYLFTDKPVVFFAYDLEKYQKHSREMYFDYEEYTPGVKVKNQQELERVLLELLSGADSCQETRRQLRKKVFDRTEQSASATLAEEIIQMTGGRV